MVNCLAANTLSGDLMTKSELIEAFAERQALSLKNASFIVNTILESMTETLVRGEHIELRGFGSFSVKEYGAYTGRNPKTGENFTVQPKKLPVFKVGKELREAVNEHRNT